MSIAHNIPISVQGEGASQTISAYVCEGVDRMLMVCVSAMSEIDQKIESVICGGQPLTFQKACTLGTRKQHVDGQGWIVNRLGLRTEIWALINPPTDPSDIVVTFTGSVKSICSAVCYSGIKQDSPNYFSSDGVGDNVSQIPLEVDLRAGFLLFGGGAALANTYSDLKPGQEELWNEIYENEEFRVQGISLVPDVTVVMPVENTIRQAAPWAIALVGFAPAA